ncbi:DUF4382 domain-containing protein [Flavivirga sp. 57AJ16]|uniref:DUF4382 domain-containing protein n=1 Tax=Flavivirga sp. 57AJ16 TaxID=3025307 RepID=UPI002366B061|nr:DUF4382 domain-containing protein [Flavivirga sp. 57AJ16]MDD7884780.1 DUF4382 domain-containing protein [Flavivirga sp. 57AJ16]
MSILKKLKFIFPLLIFAFLLSCADDESPGIKEGQSTISVTLVDAPGDYEAVNVEIVDVMIKMNDDNDDDNGWTSLEANNETVNLLDFTGGFSKVLVERFPVPAGTLSQMRLVLGDGNTIVIKDDNDENETFDLKTPSGQQSGLKVKVNTTIEEGFAYDFVLDFDVEKSIVDAGDSDNIILKPVLYVSAEVNSGIIKGTVSPNDVPSVASVLVDDMGNEDPEDDFVISAYTDETGAFALWGVPEGTYEVKVMPVDEESDYASTSVMDVVVTKGEITNIAEPIELMLQPGTISGTISGLANDIIGTVSLNDNASASVEANAAGEYEINGIVPGDYTVTISAEGYVSQDFTITLGPEEEEIIDATLVLE